MRRATSDADDGGDLVLTDEERDLVDAELGALLPALGEHRREQYESLRSAVADGAVPLDAVAPLESLLEMALQTARARQLYRAEGERILTGLFRRTPRGRELAGQLAEVNAALRALAGARIDSVTVGMRTVGHFTLTIAADAATIALAVRPDGVNVDSVVVGG